ncbi:MAG: glycoside hydrolase family 127 protein [Proteobacteria bacterium]|nr:glycoside hydrolase family 127 protein [Pseudomonadota bacterium]
MTHGSTLAAGPAPGPHRSKSRHTPVPFTAVELRDSLWAPRQRSVRQRTLPFLFSQYEKAGVFEALDVHLPPGPLRVPFNNRPTTPVMYWDSDICKWIETACYTLATQFDPALDARLDEIIARIAKAQQPDGYFNTYFIRREPAKRWTNLRDWHELYCAGHLIEAAVAHAQATGKQSLLKVMCRYADYIATVFGPGDAQRRGYCGHPEIELALVRLYRLTKERRYLDLARYFVDERGRQPHYFDQEARRRGEGPEGYFHGTYEYSQSHVPVREQRQVVGHAVRAMYLYSAMADLAGETEDPSLVAAGERLWADLTGKRLYVTGGLGPSARNEGFTDDYDLPNETAYAETCAAIGLIFWAHRLLQLDGDGRYADMMELALYNGALSGLSLDGEHFFYDNPLASRGNHHRWQWHRCPCCPANIGRLIASLGEYVYSAGPDEVAVHLYVQGRGRIAVAGTNLSVVQETAYPWDGTIAIRIDTETAVEFALRLRIPGWCRSARLAVNGTAVDVAAVKDRGYAHLKRRWQSGDRVTLALDMPAERNYAHPDVRADLGRVALKRGPIVYCLESVDQEVPLHWIALPRLGQIEPRFEPNLLGGVGTLLATAAVQRSKDGAGALYAAAPPDVEPIIVRAIPYHAWDHRDPGEMNVWIREI